MARILSLLLLLLTPSLSDAQVPVGDLTCTRSCGLFQNDLAWINMDAYDFVDVLRDGVLQATLGGGSTSYSDVGAGDSHLYEVVGTIGAVGTPVPCSIGLLSSPYPDHIVLALEGVGGSVDSVAVLEGALIARGDSYTIVTDVEQLPCSSVPGPPTIVWSLTGTFPDHTPLDQDTGAWLAQHVAAGGGVYHEGGDTWTIDPPTAFAAVDGVENGASSPGDDSLMDLVGVGFFAGFAAPYDQDQAGDDSNDWLVPNLSTDVAGTNATAVWQDGTLSNTVGIFYATDFPFGNVFVQSFELGGYLGAIDPFVDDIITGIVGRCVRISELSCSATPTQIDLAWIVDTSVITEVRLIITEPNGSPTTTTYSGTSLLPTMQYTHSVTSDGTYLFTLETSCSASSGSGLATSCSILIRKLHIRGDANDDGGVNIADAIDILSKLFGVGGSFPCDNAADGNNDGSINIGDGVFIVATLFTPGAPPIPPPFPNCGVDGEHDLTCNTFNSCPP